MRLIRRVGALEAVAEERRTAPYRRLAAETGAPLDELLATADEARTFVERLRRVMWVPAELASCGLQGGRSLLGGHPVDAFLRMHWSLHYFRVVVR